MHLKKLSFEEMHNSARSNDAFKKMKKNQVLYNERFSKWYKEMFDETNLKRYKSKGERLIECYRFQTWDGYFENKILDNTSHFRCRNRFCLNCQILINAYHAYRLKPILSDFEKEGYIPYMLTLTVPNCNYADLRKTIKKMNEAFNKLFKKFNADDRRGFGPRFIKIHGSIKVLEVTVNKDEKTFHPHFHVLVLLMPDKDDMKYLRNNIHGRYSHNKGKDNMMSLFSIQIMKMWSMIWYGETIRKKDFNSWPDDPNYSVYDDEGNFIKGNLNVNLQPFVSKVESNGVMLDNNTAFAELLKYCIEFSLIYNIEIFKYLETQLTGVRRIQGSGILSGILKDINEDEHDTEGVVEELILEKKEDPQRVITKDLHELYTTYHDFVKLYRKNTSYDKGVYDVQVSNQS